MSRDLLKDKPYRLEWPTLLRFSTEAWKASPAGALAEALLTLVEGVLPAASLWAGRELVNAWIAFDGGVVDQVSAMAPWAVLLAVLAAAGHLAGTWREDLVVRLKPLIGLRLEKELLAAASRMQLERYEEAETYDSMVRARSALGYRLTNMLSFLARIIRHAVALFAYGIVLFSVTPLLALIVVLPAIPSVAFKVRAARSGYVHDYNATPVRREMSYIQDLMLGRHAAPEVRVFGLFSHFADRWRAAHRRWRKEVLSKAWVEVRAAIGTTAVQVLAYAGAISVLAGLIARGALQPGDYVVLAGSAAAFQGELESLLWQIRYLAQDLPVLKDLHRFLNTAAALESSVGAREFPRPLVKGIKVRNLSFRYPQSSDMVLKDISFEIGPNEMVAVVGPNGAGKSTLIKLLLGLYHDYSGEITYDGVSIREIHPAAIARNCSAVFQDFARFRRPVREEIAAGDASIERDEDKLWEIMESVGLGDRIRSFPLTLDTVLDPSLAPPGEGGELSGGEWQRIAIARALVRDPQVVVLDEPTAALDPEAEVEVYRRFADIARGRMAILVSHRMGSARLADRILVLDRGRLVESGTHEELLAKRGLYARMWEAQAQWYQDSSLSGGSNDEVTA